MRHTSAKVTLRSPDLSKAERVILLVDTGSTYTRVSNVVLERLGIKVGT